MSFSVAMAGVNWQNLTDGGRAYLRTSYVSAIVEACGVTSGEVTDLERQVDKVSLVAQRYIQGFIRVPAGLSASEVAAMLRANTFSAEVEASTRSVVSGGDALKDASVRVEAVQIEPVAFSTSTSTRTTTTTSARRMISSSTIAGSSVETTSTQFLSTSTATTHVGKEDVLSGADVRSSVLSLVFAFGWSCAIFSSQP